MASQDNRWSVKTLLEMTRGKQDALQKDQRDNALAHDKGEESAACNNTGEENTPRMAEETAALPQMAGEQAAFLRMAKKKGTCAPRAAGEKRRCSETPQREHRPSRTAPKGQNPGSSLRRSRVAVESWER